MLVAANRGRHVVHVSDPNREIRDKNEHTPGGREIKKNLRQVLVFPNFSTLPLRSLRETCLIPLPNGSGLIFHNRTAPWLPLYTYTALCVIHLIQRLTCGELTENHVSKQHGFAQEGIPVINRLFVDKL
jgi:hypothetical protein